MTSPSSDVKDLASAIMSEVAGRLEMLASLATEPQETTALPVFRDELMSVAALIEACRVLLTPSEMTRT